jgi:hypothetical protein
MQIFAWNTALLENVMVPQLVKKCSAFSETRSFATVKITVFWDVTPFCLLDTNVSEKPAAFIFRMG